MLCNFDYRAVKILRSKIFLRIDSKNPEKDRIVFVAKAIKEGKIVIYPTDTVYGIGCDINSDSVKRIFEIKKRNSEKPLSIAFSDFDMAKKYVFLEEKDERFIKEHIHEPYTFIVGKKKNVPDIVTSGKEGVGVRIIDHVVTRGIIDAVGIPIITTSANISGRKPPRSVEEIDDEIKREVDIIIDSGPCRVGKPSKIIDLRSREVLRE